MKNKIKAKNENTFYLDCLFTYFCTGVGEGLDRVLVDTKGKFI